MRSVTKGLGIALLFAVVGAIMLIFIVPPFLDRIYYRGPVTDHFDGAHFFNPDVDDQAAASFDPVRVARFLARRDRTPWPATVPVQPTRPKPRVMGAAMRATWIGHSTVLVQTQGLNILVDPIWSETAGPFGFGPRRVRAPGVRFADLPRIDLVLVSHDHYDHMDITTLGRLWARDHPLIVTSLGNDAILRGHGIAAQARDWGGRVYVAPGVAVIVERVHHWGTRWGKDRNRALWSGFTIVLPGGNLFFAGDTGMGDGRWIQTAAARGPIRLAILPIGAIEPRAMMRDSHVAPADTVDIFTRLHAKSALGVHWGTFQLSNEGIDVPPTLLARALAARGIAADRFRTTEVGIFWDVPAMR